MSEKTIRQVVEEYGLSRFTLQQVADRGDITARQSGSIWLLDMETEKSKLWLAAHWNQPRVKGKKKEPS